MNKQIGKELLLATPSKTLYCNTFGEIRYCNLKSLVELMVDIGVTIGVTSTLDELPYRMMHPQDKENDDGLSSRSMIQTNENDRSTVLLAQPQEDELETVVC